MIMEIMTEFKIKRSLRTFVKGIKFPYVFTRNYFLVKKYPFLKPSCGWGVDMNWKRKGYKYHYEETWLDNLPKGWRKSFGKALCDDLKREIENSHLTDYKIRQIKEKWGLLTIYDEGGNHYTQGVIDKYEKLSGKVCQGCGKEAEYMTLRWIGFYCKDCIDKMDPNVKYKKICDGDNEWKEIDLDKIEFELPVHKEEKFYGYTFKMTCSACPEQYDVYKGKKYVAYIRKRWGHLNAYYTKGKEIDWNEPFYSVNEGDSYSGTIENKMVHFKAITELLTEHLKTTKKK